MDEMKAKAYDVTPASSNGPRQAQVRAHVRDPSSGARMMSCANIVEGLKNGDAKAAQALYERYGQTINRLVWRLLGADLEHDDVVHQVLVNILESIRNLRNQDKLDTWVLSLTVNTIRHEIRRRKVRRHNLHFVSDYPEDPALPNQQDHKVPVRRFFEVLSSMRANDRIIFSLRFVERYTVEEIASMLGLSLTTTKRKLASARQTFLKKARRDAYLAGWAEKSHE